MRSRSLAAPQPTAQQPVAAVTTQTLPASTPAQAGAGEPAAAAASEQSKASPKLTKSATAKPAAGAPMTASPAAPAAASLAPIPPPAPPPPSREVAFNPHTLDPKTNAKLKIELSNFPDGQPFTVEMNGKIYLNAISGNDSALDNLFVPPGVQEFRVTAKSGGMDKTSNIASGDFAANKRKKMKIELQGKTKSKSVFGIFSATPAAFSPDAQILVSIK
jgi:hypothetical protein